MLKIIVIGGPSPAAAAVDPAAASASTQQILQAST
jgi:hypothetical protein